MTQSKMTKKLFRGGLVVMALALLCMLLTACSGQGDEAPQPTPKPTVAYPPMTEVEEGSLNEKILLLTENAEAYEATGEVSSGEDIYATIQEIYALNLTDEQKQEVNNVIKRLPETYRSFTEGITGQSLE